MEFDEGVYHGSTRGGVPHGRGTLEWADTQTRFEGRFVNGLKHGKGRMVFEECDGMLSGTWVDDEMEGQGEYILGNGVTLRGCWKDGTHPRRHFLFMPALFIVELRNADNVSISLVFFYAQAICVAVLWSQQMKAMSCLRACMRQTSAMDQVCY